jgi:formamidopyrimidine-DNA glycosylase
MANMWYYFKQMKQSALRSVFFFQRMVIGLDNYKGKESLSRVVVLPDMIEQDISRREEAIIYLEEIGVQEGQPIWLNGEEV